MNDDELSPGQIRKITAYVDIHLPPPDVPVALILFGTNQAQPATIAARRYHLGLAPLIIATGGVNRHNGITEGQVFQDLLTGDGVPGEVIRVEDQSANTWQNVELSGLPLTVVSKWYHRRAVHTLRTLLPDAGPFYAIRAGCHYVLFAQVGRLPGVSGTGGLAGRAQGRVHGGPPPGVFAA